LLCRFTDLTGTDYSDGAVELAGAVAERRNMDNITFLVDDVLDSKLNRQFRLVTDKGTLDAIGLHPDGLPRRFEIWSSCLFSLEYADNVSRLKFEQYKLFHSPSFGVIPQLRISSSIWILGAAVNDRK
jgi:hypothetical protein